jgi:hypothetical protein
MGRGSFGGSGVLFSSRIGQRGFGMFLRPSLGSEGRCQQGPRKPITAVFLNFQARFISIVKQWGEDEIFMIYY